MEPAHLESAFRRFLDSRGVRLESAPPAGALRALLEFYAVKRLSGVVDEDGDMLLFQWGTYDWGAGSHFELELVRQAIATDPDEDESIQQLRLTYRFDPLPLPAAVEKGDHWCHAPDELEEFSRFVLQHDVWKSLEKRSPSSVSLTLETV